MSECEWNPAEDRPARTDDPSHGSAALSIGKKPNWHLCASCAALPRFGRLKIRVPLKPWNGPPRKDATP